MKIHNILLSTLAIVSASCNIAASQPIEQISSNLKQTDIYKYKQALSQASDSDEVCSIRYRMVRGIAYDVAVTNFVDSINYCGTPEQAVETLCTMYRGKKVDWLAFGLGDRQVDDRYCY